MCQVCQEDDDGYQQADLSLSPDNAGLANLQKGLKEIPDKLRKTLQIIQTENRYERYGGFPKSFCWLIEHLLPPARSVDTIKGCELIFPDTVFFERGKAKLVVKMDKDYCLQGFKNATKLNIQNIYKDFSNAVRERKKDTHGIFYMRYGPNFAENNAIDQFSNDMFQERPTDLHNELAMKKRDLTRVLSSAVTNRMSQKKQKQLKGTISSNTMKNKMSLTGAASDHNLTQFGGITMKSTVNFLNATNMTMKSNPNKSNNAANTSSANQNQTAQPSEGNKGIFFKDSALLRFVDVNQVNNLDDAFMKNFEQTEAGEVKYNTAELAQTKSQVPHYPVQVVSDTGLMSVFTKRANDDFWKTISCIQTNVKAQIGCGTPIIVRFYAPLDREDPGKQIEYDFRSLGEDEDLIKNDEQRYCLKQAYKICFYVSKLYQCEILRMKCEFVKDHNRTIWFQYAQDIWVRPNMHAVKATEDQAQRIRKINEDHREHLLLMNEIHASQNKERELSQKLGQMMSDHYQHMREKAGIDEIGSNSEGSDMETENVFKQLRPDAGYKLMDLLTGKVKPEKAKKQKSAHPKAPPSLERAPPYDEKLFSYTNLLPKDQSEPKLQIAQVTDYNEQPGEEASVKSPIHLPKAVVENFIVNPSRVTNQMRQQMKEKRQI